MISMYTCTHSLPTQHIQPCKLAHTASTHRTAIDWHTQRLITCKQSTSGRFSCRYCLNAPIRILIEFTFHDAMTIFRPTPPFWVSSGMYLPQSLSSVLLLCLCVHIYAYVCMYVCMLYVNIRDALWKKLSACIYVCPGIHGSVCLCMYVCMYTCMHV